MGSGARPIRRPLLGVLLLLVTVLVSLSALSSPPWAGAEPIFGLPSDACGLVGRLAAAVLLGFLGVPLALALVTGGVLLVMRWMALHPERPWTFLGWSLLTAFALSLFAATVGGGELWGVGPHRVASGLAAAGFLGPIGSALVSGGLLLALLVFGLPRWIPWRRLPSMRPALDLAIGLAAVPVAATQRGRDRWLAWRAERAEHAEEAARLRAAEAATIPAEAVAGGDQGPRRPRRSWDHLIPRRARRSEVEEEGEVPDLPRDAQPRRALVDPAARQPGAPVAGSRVVPRRPVPDPEDAALQGAGAIDDEAYDDESYEDKASEDTAYEDESYDDEAGEDDAYEDALDASASCQGSRPRETELAGLDAPVPAEHLDIDLAEVGLDSRTLHADHGVRPAPAKKRPRKRGGWALPPLELLEEKPHQVGTLDRDEVVEKSKVLVQTLADFGIRGRIGQVHPGPVITQYEYEPAAGIRISQIVSRADDIALALRASRIRMVAPIPGKAAVGIEVPNRRAELISLREILEETDPKTVKGHLPLFLGRDIRGRPQHTFLEKMPHMLVAGTTGSGKSVCLNTCIFSLLYKNTPEDLRLLMIDPKMLELTVYDGIPHLLCPVVTDARMAAKMLNWMVGEMERRYRKMAAYGVRNIEGFKEKLRQGNVAEDDREPMPYVVVIVDELADLMLTLANEIETPIARLAQMARAVGIHLILATQRPSVDVITGVIKANFPSRIGFQVATKVDSRTILDTNGAESLLGKGDMLFLPPGQGTPVRMHGAFVSDQDAEELVKFLSHQPEPEPIFREDMLKADGETSEIDDDLFEDALRLIVMQQQASVSFLQRRLKVGYSRAGRLMDLLESAGAVGPAEGSKPREILADESFLHEWMARSTQGAAGGKM